MNEENQPMQGETEDGARFQMVPIEVVPCPRECQAHVLVCYELQPGYLGVAWSAEMWPQ